MAQQDIDKSQLNNDNSTVAKPQINVPERYKSRLLDWVVPFIAVRYGFEAIDEINPFDAMGKRENLLAQGALHDKSGNPLPRWTEPVPPKTAFGKVHRYITRNLPAIGMGATFLGVIGHYSNNTLKDIKSLYAEPVAYELDKKTEDVTLHDIFVKSQNKALAVTRSAYVNRTGLRLATAGSFLVPWQMFRGFKELQPKNGANAKAGVGIMGLYLIWENFFREKSFFDAEQDLASSAINHTHANPNQSITSMNVKSLMLLHRKHLNPNYEWPDAETKEGKEQLMLAERIASLLNQTYRNDPRTEHAHLTIGKFNFLVGFDMLEKFPESMAYVELANRSKDMKDVKQVKAAIDAGKDAREAFSQFGIDLDKPNAKAAEPAQDTPEKTFSDRVPQQRFDKPQIPKSHFDYAADKAGLNLAP